MKIELPFLAAGRYTVESYKAREPVAQCGTSDWVQDFVSVAVDDSTIECCGDEQAVAVAVVVDDVLAFGDESGLVFVVVGCGG